AVAAEVDRGVDRVALLREGLQQVADRHLAAGLYLLSVDDRDWRRGSQVLAADAGAGDDDLFLAGPLSPARCGGLGRLGRGLSRFLRGRLIRGAANGCRWLRTDRSRPIELRQKQARHAQDLAFEQHRLLFTPFWSGGGGRRRGALGNCRHRGPPTAGVSPKTFAQKPGRWGFRPPRS